MTDSELKRKAERLAQLREEVAQLERELSVSEEGGQGGHWESQSYYTAYHATSGMMLGAIAAVASLLFNVVGSLIVQQEPLRLIQVYLTFPLGEKALAPGFDTGVALAVGCCLYIGTGMLLGVVFQLAFARFVPHGSFMARLAVGSVLGLLLWAINFYLILAWLQPVLFGGRWITDPAILPPWVGAATHLVFAWTMAALYPWGTYTPYRRQTEYGQAA